LKVLSRIAYRVSGSGLFVAPAAGVASPSESFTAAGFTSFV
jgi:hypothetical protein